jgi:hypothetical protein
MSSTSDTNLTENEIEFQSCVTANGYMWLTSDVCSLNGEIGYPNVFRGFPKFSTDDYAYFLLQIH